MHSDVCLKVFSPAKVIFIGFAVLLSVCTPLKPFVQLDRNTNDSQTAKEVRADQDALFEIFERIEAFFQRLNVYTEVALNEGMMDTVTGILVDVLNFIGIATKQIKQGRISKSFV